MTDTVTPPPARSVSVVVAPGDGPGRGLRLWKRLTRTNALLTILGVAILLSTANWWAGSVGKNRLKRASPLWFLPHEFLGLDFLHNYHAARHWMDGGNPYVEPFGDPLGRKLCYPPIVTPLFAWCRALPQQEALYVWTAALGLIVAGGAWAACRARSELGLTPVPTLFAVAAVMNSSPVLYAMERGNYDLLTLPLIVLAGWAVRERTLGRDITTGTALALAACLKVYPALLVLSLIPLRRGRAFGVAIVAGAAFASYQPNNLAVCVANLKELAFVHNPAFWGNYVVPGTHSLTMNWEPVWQDTRLQFLGKIPPPLAVVLVFGPVLAWVGYRVYRCPNVGPAALPYFLWTAALATFVPKVANDYNLFFLPLAILAVWGKRDPLPVHLLMGFVLLWLQPLAFPISPTMCLAFKVGGIFAVAACLAARLRERTPA